QNVSSRVTGVTENYGIVRNTNVAEGEWISKAQVDGRSNVVVLGDTVAKELFPDSDPVGQNVRLSVGGRTGTNFRVIGVTEAKGASGLGNTDDGVYVPITTVMARLFAQRTARGAPNVSTVNVQVVSEAVMDETVAQIGDLLRTRHKVAQDDFTIQSQQDFLNTFNQVAGTFTLLLGAIAGISLVVGGIGIMNIMLVSVTERTREIGIRKAVGARRRDILTQFLVEAIVVSVLGGAIGIALGTGFAGLISQIQVPGPGGASSNLQTQVGAESVMPEVDGWEVCRRLRKESDLPIIMLTARGDDVDKIVGLELGADDYMTKPFNARELVARVKAVLRRYSAGKAPEKVLQVGDLRIDPGRHEVTIGERPIELRPKEFELLTTLARNP